MADPGSTLMQVNTYLESLSHYVPVEQTNITSQGQQCWMLWNKEKYNSLSSPYSDNILTKSLQHQLCQKVPIDVVYTWVNGSDPILIKQIAKYRDAFYEELSKQCPYTNCVPSHIVSLRRDNQPFYSRSPESPSMCNVHYTHYLITTARSWQTDEIQQNILGLISFLSPKHLEKVSVPTKYREYTPNNWTLIYFHSAKQAFEASQISRNSELVLFEMYNAHWTTVEIQSPGDIDFQASISRVQWMGVGKGDGGENIGGFWGGQGVKLVTLRAEGGNRRFSVGGPCRRGGCIPSRELTIRRVDEGWRVIGQSPGNTKSRWEVKICPGNTESRWEAGEPSRQHGVAVGGRG
uniref:Stealth protein CR1 conserved region 1 domain-containing protein n=1 Tax=Timema cristinae TaxID=61476 RepID=A0A7R9CSE7_TIMCR|nr:unnamed protein product [Timema cristinae]